MAVVAGSKPRILKLSEVKFYPRNYSDAYVRVDSDGYTGESTVKGAELVDEVSLAQHNKAKPTDFLVADSAKNPGDVICVPMMGGGEDYIELTWISKGRAFKLNLAKLLTLKEILVPEGTRMVISLYQDDDPDYGPVVGMKLKGAAFEPKQKGKPRKKKGDNPTAPGAPAASAAPAAK